MTVVSYLPKNITIVLKLIIRIFWKLFVFVKFLVRCRRVFLVLPLVVAVVLLWPTCWWLTVQSSKALLPPLLPVQLLQDYRKHRSLQHYMRNIQVLIEPSSPCGGFNEVPVIIIVASAPYRIDQREAVRETWAKYQPTYFLLGLHGENEHDYLVSNFIEAKQYNDLIVFDFRDHYQNLTLKTALMLKWTVHRCPQARFLYKTDDDVMVNPWTFDKVLRENVNAQLVGYSHNNSVLHRRDYEKWYLPRWLFHEERPPAYLAGAGYLIRGHYIKKILKKAYKVPTINLEDIYYTYLVAHKELGLTLTHDRRLNPYKPWLKISCVYWGLATVQGLGAEEMLSAWSKIESLVDSYNNNESVCWFVNSCLYYFSDLILH